MFGGFTVTNFVQSYGGYWGSWSFGITGFPFFGVKGNGCFFAIIYYFFGDGGLSEEFFVSV